MKIMTPKAYYSLLFKVFFKGYTFINEIADSTRKQRLRIVLWANIYNALISVILIGIVFLLSFSGLFAFDVTKALKGVTLGIALGIIHSLTFGIVSNIGGVGKGIASGIASSVALGIALGVSESFYVSGAFGFVFSIVFGFALGCTLGFSSGFAFWGTIFILLLSVDEPVIALFFALITFIFNLIFYGGNNYYDFEITLSVFVGALIGDIVGVGGFACILGYIFTKGHYFHGYRIIYPQRFDKNPLVWDENFKLPFPFLPKILKSYTHKKNINYAKEVSIFLIKNCPVHRKAAQKFMFHITIHILQETRYLKDIGTFRQRLNYLPEDMDLQAGFMDNLQVFVTISKDIDYALNDSNITYKLKVYEQAIKNLSIYKHKSNWREDNISIEFTQLATQWQGILQEAVQTIKESKQMPLPNPFVVGRIVKEEEGKAFIKRKDIVEEIRYEALHEAGTGGILFLGNRRTGKTSTLFNMESHLHSSLKVAFLDFQNPQIHSSLQHFAKTFTQRLESATYIKPGEEVDNLASLSAYIEEVDKALSLKGEKLLICLDEYEKLTEGVASGKFTNVPDTLRYWIQHLDRIIFLFAGSHEVSELTAVDWSSYLINLRTVNISYLDKASALKLVTQPVTNFDLSYRPEHLAQDFAQRLGGQPYLMQAAMFELVNLLNQDGSRKTATEADTQDAIEKMFTTAHEYFHHFWNSELNATMRQMLTELIQQSTIATEDNQALHKLLKKEIIKPANGSYTFCVPVVREWIEENVL